MLREILIFVLILNIQQGGPAIAEESDLQKMRTLEAKLAQDPTRFDGATLEELRMLYRFRDPRRSAVLADRILQHRVMDETTLASLEGDPGSPVAAAHRLIHRGHRWPDLPHLRAACSIRAAEKLKAAGRREDARRLLDAVLKEPGPSLAPYRELAIK